MMASTMPWAPIVAFMVASPLTSPQELVYSAGLFGWPFATAFFLASIVLGLAGGVIAGVIEKRGWLANQARFLEPATTTCSTCQAEANPSAAPGRVFSLETPEINLGGLEAACGWSGAGQLVPAAACGCVQSAAPCGCAEPGAVVKQAQALIKIPVFTPVSSVIAEDFPAERKPALTPAAILKELYTEGRLLLLMFLGFAFVGYFLNGLIPSSWITALFGSGKIHSIPLAATLGLPLYINTETSLPLIHRVTELRDEPGSGFGFHDRRSRDFHRGHRRSSDHRSLAGGRPGGRRFVGRGHFLRVWL